MPVGGYFKRTTRFWIVTISVSFGFFTLLVFTPDVIPLDCLGPLGSLCRHLLYYHADLLYLGWCAAVAIHALEAAYAFKLCRDKGINQQAIRWRWVGQTFLFGYASLNLLIKYNPRRQKRY
ncbi:transmembrane protein 254 [Gambusia affinis]|uniref:transmembrane protein 254 n=1 Tax=Gambusia affinis TaxID=33528 RepID=UPI000F332E96|nr:transmembrane protein 254 [Gambusia affinis]